MMQLATVRSLEAQKNRAIASILAAKDECEPYLPDDLARKLRKAVLDAVNDLHTHTLLIVTAAEDDLTVNELIIDRIAAHDDPLAG